MVGALVVLDRKLPAPQPARASAPAHRALPGQSAPVTLRGGAKIGVPGTVASACIALGPTSGDRGRTVFVDPGHGGPDPGTSGRGPGAAQLSEKDAALATSLELAAQLRARGLRVVLARTQDTTVAEMTDGDLQDSALRPSAERRDLLARVACADTAHADLLVAVHFNGFSDPSVGGTQSLYDSSRSFSGGSRDLARAVQSALVGRLRLDDRGATSEQDLDAPTLTDAATSYGHLLELGPAQPGWLDRPTTMPGTLVEPLFLTKPAEAAVVADPAGRRAIAAAIADGIGAYLASL